MSDRKKVLITGGSGLLALNMSVLKRNDWDVHLLVNDKNVVLPNVSVLKVNLEDIEILEKMIGAISPDFIIHAAGYTTVEGCEQNQYRAYVGNVLIAKNIATVSRKLSIQLVHISTDHFSDSSMEYSQEKNIELPINVYAQTKMQAEFEVIRQVPTALVLRTNFFAWGTPYRKSFSDFIIKSLRRKEVIKLFSDVFFTPISVSHLVEAITELVDRKEKGVFNVVGDERVSKYEFGVALAKVFELDATLIEKVSIANMPELVSRPADMSLSNKKLKELIGEKDLSLQIFFEDLRAQEFDGICDVLRNAVTLPQDGGLNYGKQVLDDLDIEAVLCTLNSSMLTQGPKINEFEKKVALYVGSKYAVAVSNLTNGLHIACLAAGVIPGDSVITSPISFVSSSNCAIFAGAEPVFVDIENDSLNLDPELVRRECQIRGNVKAIIPVHFAGAPCNLHELKRIADEFGAVLIEDAAHGLGGEYLEGGKIGGCQNSLMTGFSFHPVKSITTGEGEL